MELSSAIEHSIALVGFLIEAAGVAVIMLGFMYASARYVRNLFDMHADAAFVAYRRQLARALILGLEFLIAGDIIRTVVVESTLQSVAVLGLIVLIRTFLSITLHLEVEGRWPWQAAKPPA